MADIIVLQPGQKGNGGIPGILNTGWHGKHRYTPEGNRHYYGRVLGARLETVYSWIQKSRGRSGDSEPGSGTASGLAAVVISLEAAWTYLGCHQGERRQSVWIWTAAVVVVALTVDDRDIERAQGRADTLAAVTGVATLALMVGETINPPQWSGAQGRGVTLLPVDS